MTIEFRFELCQSLSMTLEQFTQPLQALDTNLKNEEENIYLCRVAIRIRNFVCKFCMAGSRCSLHTSSCILHSSWKVIKFYWLAEGGRYERKNIKTLVWERGKPRLWRFERAVRACARNSPTPSSVTQEKCYIVHIKTTKPKLGTTLPCQAYKKGSRNISHGAQAIFSIYPCLVHYIWNFPL